MADADRASSRAVTLLKQLEQEPYTFDFFQAVRRLDCAHPDKPQTGESVRLIDDPIRFGQKPSLIFAPATLESFATTGSKTPRLIQRFFGLFGPQGPLPLHITEYVRERIRNHDDHTLRRFFDIFHHRMTAMFYRAWARVRPTVSFDQPSSDRFSDYVGTLFGLGMESLEGRDAFPDLPKRHFAGLMSNQTHHAEGLLAILSGYFRLPVQLEEFVGQWIELPANCRCLMGQSSSGLGVNTTVGSHVWDCQQKFRVIFGPLRLEDYYRMLPGGSSKSSSVEITQEMIEAANASGRSVLEVFGQAARSSGVSLDRLMAAVRSYTGDELQWDLQLILKKQETPPLGLGIVGRLGWSSWLIRDPMPRDPDDLVLDAMRVPDDVESVQFARIRNWSSNILGQTRDGQYIVATINSDGSGISDIADEFSAITTVDPVGNYN
jgi:type VI secretion system protein ImpH